MSKSNTYKIQKFYFLLKISLLFLLIIGSKIYGQETEKCNFVLESNKFSKVKIESVQSIVGQDTITINELRFMCTICSCTMGQVMFDKFGKWDKTLPDRTLIWENIQLFGDSNKKYTIATSGNESYQNLYSSVMVFDQNSRDVLQENNPEKQKFIDVFSSMISENKKGISPKFKKEYAKLKKE